MRNLTKEKEKGNEKNGKRGRSVAGKEKCIFNSRKGKTKERTACSARG